MEKKVKVKFTASKHFEMYNSLTMSLQDGDVASVDETEAKRLCGMANFSIVKEKKVTGKNKGLAGAKNK